MSRDSRDLRETEANVRAVMPEESTIDLDLHARAIAAAAVAARRRSWAQRVRAAALREPE